MIELNFSIRTDKVFITILIYVLITSHSMRPLSMSLDIFVVCTLLMCSLLLLM